MAAIARAGRPDRVPRRRLLLVVTLVQEEAATGQRTGAPFEVPTSSSLYPSLSSSFRQRDAAAAVACIPRGGGVGGGIGGVGVDHAAAAGVLDANPTGVLVADDADAPPADVFVADDAVRASSSADDAVV